MIQEQTRLPEELAGIHITRHEGGEPEEPMVEIVIRILTVLISKKKFILGITLALMTIAAISVSFMRNYFKADAVILPPQQQQSSLAAFSSGMLGGLAGSSIASQLGLKDPADFYIGILKSRTIAESIITRFHLQNSYHVKLVSEARGVLMRHVNFAKSKESFITITVEDYDPKLAAAMANAFVEELYKQNSQLAVTDATHRRQFFEGELSREKNAMAEAEAAMKASQLKTGLIVPSGQAETLVRSAAQLRAEISSREVALQSMRSYATDENAQVQVLQREIAAARAQLAQLKSNGESGSNFEVSAGKLPEASLEYLRRMRDLKYHETLYELLAKQYEAARIDEAKEAPALQVLDRATVPEKKAGPARLTIVLLVGLLGAVLTSIWAYVTAALKAQLLDPRQAANLASLRAAVRIF